MNYGRAIRTCRVAMGLQQKCLAIGAGITPSFLSLIESEKRKPSVDNVNKISKALGVPMHLLMLLAAESEDLKERPEQEIQQLAKSLLEILVATPMKKVSAGE